MATQGEYHQRRYMWLVQLYPNIFKALLLASLINGDYGVHGQHHRQNFQCHEEGYHADPSDCQMYYRCVAWGNNSPLTKFDFKCGPGTVFSHANGDICVHPRESERSECHESENDLDSNMNYPQSNEGSFPSYGQADTSPSYVRPPAEHNYQQPQTPPSYGTPPPNRPNYQQAQTSFDYGEQTTRPSYGSPQSSPSYNPSYSPSSTESPFNNEIDQPAYLPASQSPPSTSSHSPPTATTADNSIPHPISTTTVAGIATGQSDCRQEGFFANLNNCKKFFRCVGDGRGSYLKYDFTCGEGTVWDPMTEGCNHAWAVSRDDCRTPSEDIDGDSNGNNGQDVDQSQSSGGDHENDMTSQLPWQPDAAQAPIYPSYPSSQSSNGYPVPSATMAAPFPPTYIPPSETTSQSSSLASAPSSTPLETEHSTSMPPNFASSPSGITEGNGNPPESSSTSPGSTDSSSSSSSSPPTPTSSECPEEGFFADPNDCMKFYRCVQEVNSLRKYDFTCGEDTAWDQSIQSCNHKYAVSSCSGKDHNNEQTTVSSGEDVSNPSSEPDKDLETSTQDQGENQLGVTNPSTSTESPTNVETSSSPPSSSETPSTTGISSKPTTTKPQTTIGESTNENNQKPAEMPPSSEAPQPTTTSEEPSPTTTSSSETDKDQETTTQGIDQTQSSPTSSPSSSTTPELSSIPESSSSSPTTQSSMPEKPSSAKPEESPKPSTSEKEPSSTTVKPTSPNKPNGQTGDAECKEEGFLPHPNDCRKFLRCVSTGDNGFTKYTFDCGPGTAWDQSLLTCNYIEKVASCGSESNEIPSGPEGNEQMSTKPTIESMPTSTTVSKEEQGNDITPTTVNNQDDKSTAEPSSSSTTESSNLENNESTSKSPDKETSEKPNDSGNCTTTKPTNNGIVCDMEGFHANPTYCGKFYRCVDNGNGFNVYHFDCPGGTIFDPSINVCNYPESVYPQRNCEGGEASPGPSTSETPNATSSTEKPSPTESGEQTTTAEASSESGSETISTEETVTESMTELIGGEETSTEAATELTEVEGTTAESATESTGTTESAAEKETTVGGETTDASTEAGITEMQTTTELSQESLMTTENAMTTEASTESSSTMTEMSTDSSTTESPESTPPSLETTTVGKTDVDNMATPCPIGNLTDEQIVLVCPTGFRRHPKYCNMFYQCSTEDDMKIKVLVLGCPEGTIYDEEKIQCRPESESSQKCDTQMASSRFYRQLEKTTVSPVRVRRTTLCPDEGHFPYQQGCSDAFYKCRKNSRNELQGYLYRCPKDYVYWSVSRRCERANRMICSHGKYGDYERIYSWENRWDLPTEQTNVSS